MNGFNRNCGLILLFSVCTAVGLVVSVKDLSQPQSARAERLAPKPSADLVKVGESVHHMHSASAQLLVDQLDADYEKLLESEPAKRKLQLLQIAPRLEDTTQYIPPQDLMTLRKLRSKAAVPLMIRLMYEEADHSPASKMNERTCSNAEQYAPVLALLTGRDLPSLFHETPKARLTLGEELAKWWLSTGSAVVVADVSEMSPSQVRVVDKTLIVEMQASQPTCGKSGEWHYTNHTFPTQLIDGLREARSSKNPKTFFSTAYYGGLRCQRSLGEEGLEPVLVIKGPALKVLADGFLDLSMDSEFSGQSAVWLSALARHGGDPLVQHLRNCVSSDKRVPARTTALLALWGAGYDVDKSLRAMLNGKCDEWERAFLVCLLAQMPTGNDVSKYLDDQSALVRISAIHGMRATKRRAPAAKLCALLQRSNREDEQDWLLGEIGKTHDRHALRPLAKFIRSHRSDQFRTVEAITAAEEITNQKGRKWAHGAEYYSAASSQRSYFMV